MNEHQRQKARRKKYAHGGMVGAVSHGMERVGRAFGAEKAKKIAQAEEFASSLQPRKAVGTRRAAQIEEAEQKALGYRHGGKVKSRY